ncbi:hypothetical protein LEMLEM_LOCUS1693 [Lemmus lemmus]
MKHKGYKTEPELQSFIYCSKDWETWTGKKIGPKDNTFIWLIRRQDAEDTATGPVWIPSARTISTWTTDMVPLDKALSPCQQEVALENVIPSP